MGTIEKMLGGPLKDAYVTNLSDWTPEDHEALSEYFEAHDWLPESGEIGEREVGRLAAQLKRPTLDREGCMRAMIRLAHCASPAATEALRRYQERVDPGLRRFAQLAFEESLVWSGGGRGEAP